MITTFGSMPTSLPDGMLTAVKFPVLARLDVETGDGRIIDSAGFSPRDLPLSIRMQERASFGHEGAIVSGALFEVTVDPEGTLTSGRGFLLDNEAGRAHALYIATGAMRGNSVDLAEVEARYEEDLDTGDYRIRFTKAKLAATTGVGTPAFGDARAELTAALATQIDEIMATLTANPMEELVCEFDTFDINILVQPRTEEIPDELLASGAIRQPYAAFFHPEGDKPQKIVVTEDLQVYGNLGVWDTCHDGIEGRCTIIPRPADGYASFNKPGVLTERGIVETGPIFAYGGHRSAQGRPSLDEAYGGIENAWADVRITEGVHGPWISGVVRPGVEDHTVYAARASRISGHWVGGRLKAIVSVNAEGFDVPGTGDIELLPELVAGFAFTVSEDGLVSDLVASFPSCSEPEPSPQDLIDRLQGGMTASRLFQNGAMFVPESQGAQILLADWASTTPTITHKYIQGATIVLADDEPIEDDGADEQATMLLCLLVEDD